MATTRSKLGGVYPSALIHAKDKEFHATLKELRLLPSNRECAECQASPSTWASVSLGCFVCMNCAQVHRNLGAHISKVKSCMGTYLWCPDEIEQMKRLGNARVWRCYTGGAPSGSAPRKPAADAPFEVRDAFARDKYERKRWMLAGGMEAVLAEEAADDHAPTSCRRQPSFHMAAKDTLPDGMRMHASAAGSRPDGRGAAARDVAHSRIRTMRNPQERSQAAGDSEARVTAPPASGEPQEDRWDVFGDWPSLAPVAAPSPPPPPPQRTMAAPVDDFFAQFGLSECPVLQQPLPPPTPPRTATAAAHQLSTPMAAAITRATRPCAAESGTDLISLFSSAATIAVPQR